jgi:hypothetical protein
MNRSTLQRAFRLALQASGIQKAAHIHTLRQGSAIVLTRSDSTFQQE